MGTFRIISASSGPFNSRAEAGRLLASELKNFSRPKAVVLGIPRGGVIVARQIADTLKADLDIVLSHKLGAPGNPELAIGAVCEDGKLFVDRAILSYIGVDDSYVEEEKSCQLEQIARRVEEYRRLLPKLPLKARVVIVTDDGVATGATMQAALWAVRREEPERIIAALPVGPEDVVANLSKDADETICLRTPPFFGAIGRFYVEFDQVEEEQLLEILGQERKKREE